MRGQTELPAIAIAFVLLTGTVVLGVSVANSALVSAERPALEQQTATGLSERLVSEEAPHTVRENVFDDEAVPALDESTLSEYYDLPPDSDVRIRLDGDVLASTGDVTGGTTVSRIVLVERRSHETVQPDFETRRTVVLPRRTSNVTLTIEPPTGTTVRTVLANDRVLLANESGIEGTVEAEISPFETTQIAFGTVGPLTEDSVRIEYAPPETRKAILEVTVDA